MNENKLIRESIGFKISKLIDKNNLQKTEIARKIGVSRSTFDSWVKGVNAMSVENVAQVANAFKVSVGYFFEESNKETESLAKEPISAYGLSELERCQQDLKHAKELLKAKDETIQILKTINKPNL